MVHLSDEMAAWAQTTQTRITRKCLPLPEDTPPGRELAPSLPRVRENVINMLHGAMPGKAFLLASRLDKGGPLS